MQKNSFHFHFKRFDTVKIFLAFSDYPVDAFNGRKSFIISTTTWSGGHNNFLGIAYIVIGSICVVLGFVFTVIHIKFGHS
jgi:hypothetical protein